MRPRGALCAAPGAGPRLSAVLGGEIPSSGLRGDFIPLSVPHPCLYLLNTGTFSKDILGY